MFWVLVDVCSCGLSCVLSLSLSLSVFLSFFLSFFFSFFLSVCLKLYVSRLYPHPRRDVCMLFATMEHFKLKVAQPSLQVCFDF
jgi:hypothetical protein